MLSSLISWCDSYFRKLNNLSQNAQNRRSDENANRLFETYKNSVMPHGHHIYATASDMAIATMCAYPPCKCVLRCCSNFTRIDLPDQESDKHYSNVSPSICFHIYHFIARCKVHGRRPLDEKKNFHLCLQDPVTVSPEKLYTRKELVMMETYISGFHKSFYIQ